MKTLMRIVGTVLAAATGVIIYDLGVRDGFVMQLGSLLLLLIAQFGAGWLLGVLMRSWRTLLAVPFAFVLGFLGADPLRAAGIGTEIATAGSPDQFSSLAGGNVMLATVFMLALLCCLLALGTATGTTRGIRIERRRAWRRARARAMRLRALAEQEPIPGAEPRQPHLAHAGR
ncbi:MAG TPA: hypothetical protein VF120_04720 [Ktedonobacterales bacterium]